MNWTKSFGRTERPREAQAEQTLFLPYVVEDMSPTKVNVTSLRLAKRPQNEEHKKEIMLDALDEMEKQRDQALLWIQNYQHLAVSYYNKKVRAWPLELNDLVLCKVFKNTKE